jgi:hypothetical protein
LPVNACLATERTPGISPETEITVNIARAARHLRPRLIFPALAVAIAALVIPLSQIASAHTTTRAAASAGRHHQRRDR